MTILMRHAAWVLIVAFGLSLIYELYRATSKAGTSRHDSMRAFVVQGIPLYMLAGIVIALLFAGREWAASVGLIFSVAMIGVSIFYYNPKIMLARQPGMIGSRTSFSRGSFSLLPHYSRTRCLGRAPACSWNSKTRRCPGRHCRSPKDGRKWVESFGAIQSDCQHAIAVGRSCRVVCSTSTPTMSSI